MEITRTLVVDAPLAHIWSILANDYTTVGQWTSVIKNSEPVLGDVLPGAPAYGRVCDTPDGVFKEKITQFDEERHVLAYEVEQGLPFFVRGGGNTWSLKRLDDARTQVNMHMKFDMPAMVEFAMGWMMRRQMAGTGDRFLEELKVFAEKGEISAAKKQQLAVA